jgi:hypothetical protein
MIDGVVVTLNVGFNHIPTINQGLFHHLYRLLSASFRTETIRAVPKIGLKDWLNYYLARLLNYPVSHGGYSQRPLSAI